MASGDENGLRREWDTQWGDNVYRDPPFPCAGRTPWVSLHEAVPRDQNKTGAWANRGIVIRSWKARLGGKLAPPFMAERGLTDQSNHSSTLDIVPPPGVTRLEPGDFVEATIEHIIMPQFVDDYYGPSNPLREALKSDANTWRMIFREAKQNDRNVDVNRGSLNRLYPDVRVSVENDVAEFALSGGNGYVPVTFTRLSSHSGYRMEIDGRVVDQSVHGNDFWQTDFDSQSDRWSQTYNVLITDAEIHRIRLTK